ncbi:hypothetical protein PR202_gb06171 [Eleusine coracana subsp. coracana]|uniref:Uncharacterized protein n=1 Tax=Eleusine coracana subsp. coracana TaxID=191504 RepID=A0AAV5E8V4_ELECO|nr:hypothetical protein PR202_gb06171 [Eleusine coracana subsp. coracana]
MAMVARRLVPFHLSHHHGSSARPLAAAAATPYRRGKHDAFACKATGKAKLKAKAKGGERQQRRALEEHLKRRTRSSAAFDAELYGRHAHEHHVPVLLGEVLATFRRPRPLSSFVDCTLGAAGHSIAVRTHPSHSLYSRAIAASTSPAVASKLFDGMLQSFLIFLMMEAHPEMELYIGMDVDPSALEIGRGHIEGFLAKREANGVEDHKLRAYTHAKNFKYIKQVLDCVDERLEVGSSGVDGILIDLGMSSMQVNRSNRGFSVLQDGPLDMRMDPKATLKAEDILNSWPELEVGRILRDYGEESNWHSLQQQIVKAREMGGLHSTGELVQLIRRKCVISGGRQGWIKTATRVFQALRIAVNDELRILEDALHSCFDCLATGGRLAVDIFPQLGG